MNRHEIAVEALHNATTGQALSNYPAIYAGFAEKGIADAAALANEIQHNRVEVPASVWAELYQATNEARAVLVRPK